MNIKPSLNHYKMSGTKQNAASIISRLNLLIASHQVAIQEAITIRNELEGLYPQAKKSKRKGVSDEDVARVRAGSLKRRNIQFINNNKNPQL